VRDTVERSLTERGVAVDGEQALDALDDRRS
jgi:hypothetical protein